MKSLHIVGSKAMGGAERWFVRFLRSLRSRGHDAEALVRRGYDLANGELGEIPFQSLPMRTVWDPLSRYEVGRLVRRSGAPVVQTYMGRATRLTRLPRHGDQVHLARLGGYYKLDGYRHAHYWIGNTRGLCDYLVENGFPADRVFHIYNFAEPPRVVPDEEQTEIRERFGLSRDDLVLLTPGRFVPVKGHPELLEAISRLPAEVAGRRVRLLLLGDGALGPELRELVRQLRIEDRVVWAGWQSDPAPFYQAADVVVFPSRYNETLGNVVLEAWSHHTPLVTTEFRGAMEIVQAGEDAWRVPCESPGELAAGIRRVAEDPGLQREMVANGVRRLDEDFSERAVMRQYLELYQTLVEAGPR